MKTPTTRPGCIRLTPYHQQERQAVVVTTRNMGLADVAGRRVSQKTRLLLQYLRYPKGLTNFEAGQHAGLPPTSAYWMRCSELLDEFLIEVVRDKVGREVTRKNPATGSSQRVCRITQDGVREAKLRARKLGIPIGTLTGK